MLLHRGGHCRLKTCACGCQGGSETLGQCAAWVCFETVPRQCPQLIAQPPGRKGSGSRAGVKVSGSPLWAKIPVRAATLPCLSCKRSGPSCHITRLTCHPRITRGARLVKAGVTLYGIGSVPSKYIPGVRRRRSL